MNLPKMSIAGAVMILAITLIRTLIINKVPKKTFLVLWGIALVRLLIPFSFPSALSIYSLLEKATPAVVKNTQVVIFSPSIPTEQISAIPHNEPSFAATLSIWTVAWLIGAALCALFFAGIYWKCRKEFQTSLPIENAFTRKWLQAHPLRRSISIRQSDLISAPLTYGVRHPVILMPKKTDWENERALKYVLEHEFVHIQRFDTLAKLLLIVAVCVHWFNPLVWIMYSLANRDIELSCDETVIHRFGDNTKTTYANILIYMEETRSHFSPLCNHFSKNAIEERITSIMKMKKTSFARLLAAAALIVSVTLVFASSASKAFENETAYLTENVGGASFEETAYHELFQNEEEFQEKYLQTETEWWTYEEYKAWLENEKVQLQGMIGEKAWTAGRGDFIWTQALVDESIAMYEEILKEIENGGMVSKTVDGDTDDFMISYIPESIVSTQEYRLYIKLENGVEKNFGPYGTANELLAAVKPFCDEQVRLGNMLQSEAAEIIEKYTN